LKTSSEQSLQNWLTSSPFPSANEKLVNEVKDAIYGK